MLVRGDAVHEISGSGPRRDLSQPVSQQLGPGSVPLRPSWFSELARRPARLTRTDWDWVGTHLGRDGISPDLPDNAEVAGSIPASPTSCGSSSCGP